MLAEHVHYGCILFRNGSIGTKMYSNLEKPFQVFKEVSGLLKAKLKDLYRSGEKTGRVRDVAAGGPYLLSDP